MQSPDKAGEILSRFPGPVTLYPSRRKWFLILLTCATFVAIGLWMIASEDAFGWVVLVFFGVGMVITVVAMIPRASALKLDREGFEITSLFRRYLVR